LTAAAACRKILFFIDSAMPPFKKPLKALVGLTSGRHRTGLFKVKRVCPALDFMGVRAKLQ